MSSKKNRSGDERFARVQRDPRFWEMPERERKVKIDKRFQSMFHEKRFQVKSMVDKRGRPVNHTTSEDLRRFYKLDSEEEEDEEDAEDVERGKVKLVEGEGAAVQSRGDEDEESEDTDDEDVEQQQSEEEEEDGVELGDGATDDSEEDEDDAEEESEAGSGSEEESGLDADSDSDSGPDLARGKGNIETSSDEDDDDDVDAILKKEEEEIEHDWGELCKDARRSEEVSTRLAVCNMDWDRMKARDLLALFNSFTPQGGAVLSVKIYPSEFGKERLKLEETQGPMELKALPEDSEDDTEEDRVYREKTRNYQFKRLRYYYAVVQCDSAKTAAKIYEECDGFEYESSCSMLDLRFIPDNVAFDEEPKDVATDVNLLEYTPKLFSSSATATSKVQLTWDEMDHDRVTAFNRNFNKDELLDMDFNAYLASSSDEEEDEAGGVPFAEPTSGGSGSEAEAGQTEDTGEAVEMEKKPPEDEKRKKKKSEDQICKYRELLKGIQDKEKKLQHNKDMEMEITWVPGLKETTEQLVKKKLEGKDEPTPWEEFLNKKKEQRKQKKSQSKQEAAEDAPSDDELPPDVDLSDPFFAEELSDVKKQKKKKKKKQLEEEERTAEEEEELEKQKAEMALLMEDDADEMRHKHFNFDRIVEQQNLSKKKRKKLLKKGEEPLETDDFQVDVKDPRFQAMFTSHLFNLDPSHPSFKKTTATQSIVAEKQRRREEQRRRRDDDLSAQTTTHAETAATAQQEGAGEKPQSDSDAVTAKKPMDPSLSLLVKSIKNKTEQFQARKRQKLV